MERARLGVCQSDAASSYVCGRRLSGGGWVTSRRRSHAINQLSTLGRQDYHGKFAKFCFVVL